MSRTNGAVFFYTLIITVVQENRMNAFTEGGAEMEQLQSISRDIFLKKTFEYLSDHDVCTVNISDIAKNTEIFEALMWSWFKSDFDVIAGAYEYGYLFVTGALFEFARERMENLKGFFDDVVSEILKYKKELRLLSYAAASVEYGAYMRAVALKHKGMYDIGAEKLAELLSCSKEDIQPAIHMFISVIHDYVVWDDFEILQNQLEYIYTFVARQLGYKFG